MTNELQSLDEYEGIRRVWDEATQELWFAVVDVIEILSEARSPRHYWADMKRRDESGQLLANCQQFPLKNRKNNRTYQTECATQEGILRIVQSIPSPKAEPFRRWLAMTGSRRLNEIQADPLEAEREKYRLLGYDEEGINARIGSISVRNQLTDEWRQRDVKEGSEYGTLTNEIHKWTFDSMTVKDHKDLKGVNKGNLRDHMTPLELGFTIVGEAAGAARQSFEENFGEKVISPKSYLEEVKRKRLKEASEKKNQNVNKPESGDT